MTSKYNEINKRHHPFNDVRVKACSVNDSSQPLTVSSLLMSSMCRAFYIHSDSVAHRTNLGICIWCMKSRERGNFLIWLCLPLRRWGLSWAARRPASPPPVSGCAARSSRWTSAGWSHSSPGIQTWLGRRVSRSTSQGTDCWMLSIQKSNVFKLSLHVWKACKSAVQML